LKRFFLALILLWRSAFYQRKR